MRIVIVGGVAGGATAAARLRRLDEKAEIIILERGEFVSFANCGLPYYISGEINNESALKLQTPNGFKSRYNVDVRVHSEALSIDRDKKEIVVADLAQNSEYTLEYDKLILSTGAYPFIPNIDGFDNDKVFTLRDIPDSNRIKSFVKNNSPKSVAIIGGGFIGIEMAESLRKLHLEVTLIEKSNHLLASLDYDIAVEFHQHVRTSGVHLMLNSGVNAIKDDGEQLNLVLDSCEIKVDFVISAIGVRPESKLASDSGLNLNRFGAVEVDEHFLTSDKDIYAIGDCASVKNYITDEISFIPLAGPANKQGRNIADNIFGFEAKYQGTLGSSILKYFDVTVASTGINEQAAIRNGIDYDKVFTFSASHAGYYPGGIPMSIKTIFEKSTGKILGAQIVGSNGVDKRCDVIATAIQFGATASDLTRLELCYAPPYSSAKDPVNIVGYVIENIVTGKIKNFNWDYIKSVPENATLLDVRTKYEYNEGSVDGFINIPVDDLRENLDKLDSSKPIYVTCQSGLRSYLACKILINNGFDCYNISGGYRHYSMIEEEEYFASFDCVGKPLS